MASVIIPLYTGLGSDWDEAVTAATNSPEVDFVFIVNPDNGVQVDSQASSYIPAIEALPANVKCLGYVYTGVLTTGLRPINGVPYTDTDGVPTSGLEENIEAYVASGYPLFGFFLDEFDGSFDQSEYATALSAYIHSLGSYYAMANPGDTNVTLGTEMNNWCIYESGGGGQPSIPSIGLTASEMSFISYGFTTFPTSYVQSVASSVAMLNIGNNSGGSGGPYDVVGSSAYFASDMGQTLTGTPQILGGGTSPPPPPTVATTYLSDFTVSVDSQTSTTITVTLAATLSDNSGGVSGQSVDFYWTPQPNGSQIMAGSGTTNSEGRVTAPAIALSTTDSYLLQAQFAGTSAYASSSAGIAYTPTGGSSPPPPPSGTPATTAISGFTASIEGTTANPIILLKGVLVDDVTDVAIPSATIQIIENGNFDSGTDVTSTDGTFAIAIEGGSPGTTYGIELSYAGDSQYAPCSTSTVITTPSLPSSPPPPPTSKGGTLAVVGVATILTVAAAGALLAEKVI